MSHPRWLFAALALVPFLAGCGGGEPRQPMQREDEWHAPIGILRHYADKDGRLTRAQLEEGLHRDFAAADTNHNGVLDPDEVRAVNEQRWKEDQSALSPLQDWNGDGVVDFSEFAATARALFNELDRDGNGVLTPNELRPPKRRGQSQESGQTEGSQDGGERPHGRRGGGPQPQLQGLP